jgi:hypothetical protein
MVLLYIEASHTSCEGLKLLRKITIRKHHPQLKKNSFLKTKDLSG